MKNDNLPKVTPPNQISSSTTSIQNPIPAQPPPIKKANKFIIIIVVILLLIIFSGGSYYLGTKGLKISLTTSKEQLQPQVLNKSTPIPTIASTPLFSGQLQKLDQNLQIFKFTEEDKLNGLENDFTYYSAGKFTQGELKDYTRIIAVRPAIGPGQPIVYILATQDFQTYILDDPENLTSKYPESDWRSPYNILDKNKITKTASFKTEQPQEITLSQYYSLYKEEFPTKYITTNNTDKSGNKIEITTLITNFTDYQKLSSPVGNLTFYFEPYNTITTNLDKLLPEEKEKILLSQKYFLGDTTIIVVDSVGLPIKYSLTTPANIKNYQDKLVQYEIDLKNYQDQLTQYQKKQITQYPQYPNSVNLPNMGFDSKNIINQNNYNFFKDYQTAIPGACASTLNSKIININENDLEQIGTVYNLPLYRLKDTKHQLYSMAFNNKMEYYNQNPSTWYDINKEIVKPTLEEYIKSNPLLFVKDYWQRWVALGEFDIRLPGGCGKPVIYLYPTIPTAVTVKFQAPIQFTTDIPKYADFWKVMANPNGTLVNLKPELTDCSQIDFHKKGSEYAKEACQTNTYPYLFWAGNIISENYPTIDKGWIVDQNNLNGFLQSKLNEIGLNNQEKNDFISYWLPEMLTKNTPFYRISFLQTNDLNLLFPMTVNPIPNTIFRLFLDYIPLTEKPEKIPTPQTLDRLVRNGFTLVEWGGLK